ncbi:MAG: MarR family transcriptional regulator [Chloroflexota bacterium]
MRLQVGQVLEALPAIRRWLVRSAHSHPRGVGHTSIPLSHIRTLLHLAQFGPMTIGELARGLGVSYSTATECAAGLEARGRVTKQRAPSDRRQVVVSLTPEAQEVASIVLAKRKGAVERVLKQLSPSERRTLIKGLTLLAKDLEGEVDGVAALEFNLQDKKEGTYAA